MSTHILKFIPTDPVFIPATEKIEEAKQRMAAIFPEVDMAVESMEETAFIDQGENFESVSCPLCHQGIEMEYWSAQMDAAFETRFANLTMTTPCCKETVSLNDLVYKAPAGFARFQIYLTDVEYDAYTKVQEELEAILGTVLKQVWARY